MNVPHVSGATVYMTTQTPPLYMTEEYLHPGPQPLMPYRIVDMATITLESVISQTLVAVRVAPPHVSEGKGTQESGLLFSHTLYRVYIYIV